MKEIAKKDEIGGLDTEETLARWGKLRGIGLRRRILCCKMQSKNMKRRTGRRLRRT